MDLFVSDTMTELCYSSSLTSFKENVMGLLVHCAEDTVLHVELSSFL